jgi:hypothetical protein
MQIVAYTWIFSRGWEDFQRRELRYYFLNTLRLFRGVGGDGLVVPSWLALCWIAQGSGFESQRGHLFFGISPRRKISQEGFAQGLVSLLPQVDI